MSRRFTDRQLYQVRNHIPIRYVIETLLAIESETVEAVFRFQCPLCSGWHTAVKPDTNLARCFDCSKNFNAIDLCMIAKHMSFVESVNFLIERQGQLQPAQSNAAPRNNDISTEQTKTPLKEPVPLHEILAGLIGKAPRQESTTTRKETLQAPPTSSIVGELERIIDDLSQILQQLKASHHLK
jgi:hypothetical protein